MHPIAVVATEHAVVTANVYLVLFNLKLAQEGVLDGVLEGAVNDVVGATQGATQGATETEPGAPATDAAAAQLAAEGAPATTGGIDYAAWEDFATRVEAALESGKVSDSVLGDLRRDLVDWRATFAAAKDKNSVRIQALRAQLTALGAPPEDGSEELAGTAAQRKALVARLYAQRYLADRGPLRGIDADGEEALDRFDELAEGALRL